jgi:hypothetical protein
MSPRVSKRFKFILAQNKQIEEMDFIPIYEFETIFPLIPTGLKKFTYVIQTRLDHKNGLLI